jgi:peroxiredoxin Q/BCP
MIDPLKATKGRRMSKKTRKKSPKAAPKKTARVVSKTSAQKSGTKAGRTSATTSAKKSLKAKASPTASHKATSKKLKAAAPQRSAPMAAVGSKPAAAKPATANTPLQADPTLAGSGASLTEGAKAPAFQLPRDGGSNVSLADYAGQKLVIFFYPRADTPGCTKEAIDFTRLSGSFAGSQTAVLGVSADPLKAQEAFRDKHRLLIPLVSDEKHEMLKTYGVWGEKSMYGKTFLGIVRTTVLIEANGKVAKIWRNVKVDGHADEVLTAARAL